MAVSLACKDLIPGDCAFIAIAPDEADLLKQCALHAAQVHGLKDVTPELMEKVFAAIKDV